MIRHGRLLGTPGSPVAFETEQARIQGEGTQGPSPPRPVFLSTLRLPSSQLCYPFRQRDRYDRNRPRALTIS